MSFLCLDFVAQQNLNRWQFAKKGDGPAILIVLFVPCLWRQCRISVRIALSLWKCGAGFCLGLISGSLSGFQRRELLAIGGSGWGCSVTSIQEKVLMAFYFISGGAYGWRETTEFSRVNRERQIKWCRWWKILWVWSGLLVVSEGLARGLDFIQWC